MNVVTDTVQGARIETEGRNHVVVVTYLRMTSPAPAMGPGPAMPMGYAQTETIEQRPLETTDRAKAERILDYYLAQVPRLA